MLAILPEGKSPLDLEINRRILSIADAAGINIYIVGGFLRDALRSRERAIVPKDIDFAIESGSAFSFAQRVADQIGGHFVPLDQANDTARVVLSDSLDPGIILDFAGCVGGTIEKDVLRRDFTINALVWSPSDPLKVIDLVGALDDLKSLTIRAISEKAFVEDPLRILRAYRFAASLGATIEPQTSAWISTYAERLKTVAAERINFELFQMLSNPCAEFIVTMGDCGLLEILFPELKETRRVTPNAFHHLGLFEHSVDTIAQLEKRLQTLPAWVIAHVEADLSFGVSRLAATKLACLLHDIGKPETWEVTDDGRHTFYAHDRLGAEMCEPIAERMKWSRPVEKFIVNLVRWHLRPGALFHKGLPTEKAVRRFYRSIGNDVPELMLLSFADFGATRGPGLMGENRAQLDKSLVDLLDNYAIFVEEDKKRVKLLDGKKIMELLSLTEGPIIGEILTALNEAQEFKEVLNAKEAEDFVVQHYHQKYCK